MHNFKIIPGVHELAYFDRAHFKLTGSMVIWTYHINILVCAEKMILARFILFRLIV